MRDERTDWLLGELNKAYRRARLGKTKTPQVVDFDKVAKTELLALAKEIHSRTYAPRPSTAFIVNRPVKREIFAADLINTVVVRVKGAAIRHSSARPSHSFCAYQVREFLWNIITLNDPLKDVLFTCPRSAWKGLPPSKSLFRQPEDRGLLLAI